jgi:mRNA-degrading endonuclease RelE of RelBE toxin-antitoxin system
MCNCTYSGQNSGNLLETAKFICQSVLAQSIPLARVSGIHIHPIYYSKINHLKQANFRTETLIITTLPLIWIWMKPSTHTSGVYQILNIKSLKSPNNSGPKRAMPRVGTSPTFRPPRGMHSCPLRLRVYTVFRFRLSTFRFHTGRMKPHELEINYRLVYTIKDFVITVGILHKAKFWRICKKCLRELTQYLTLNPFP